jgi:hypothetical protein
MKIEDDFKHKTLFFFMPEKISFLKKEVLDDENQALLKSITPYFYWCSAHEFKDIQTNNKFLFQYQIYSIENRQIVPGEVVQKWFSNKNAIKISVINFIELWHDHKRLLFDIKKISEFSISKNNIKTLDESIDGFDDLDLDSKNNFEYFSYFATFVAQSIISLKNLYIKQVEDGSFEFLQRKFWESIAIYYQNVFSDINDNNHTKSKNKKKITKKPRKTKKKNETVSNKRSRKSIH